MPAFQMIVPLGTEIPLFPTLRVGRVQKPLQRHRQRPLRISEGIGPYRMPKAVREPLERLLAPFRNAEAAFSLASFLGRFWSAPNRLETPFPVDRRALANHGALDLTEAEIRGAILTLERIGFLARPISGKGSPYRPTEDGLRRKAILFIFGGAFATTFKAANEAANRAAKRDADLRTGRTVCQRPSAIVAQASRSLRSPKNRIALEREVLMGYLRTDIPKAEPALEKALAQLAKNMGLSSQT